MKYLLMLPVALLLSCEKGPTEYGSALDVEFLPGMAYRYAWSSVVRDTLGNVISEIQDTVVLRVASVEETLDTLEHLIRIVVTSASGTSEVYYRNTQTAFTEVAYKVGGTPLVQPSIRTIGGKWNSIVAGLALAVPMSVQRFAGDRLLTRADSVIVRDDPRVVYQYPLSPGQSWVSFTNPFVQTREVIGNEYVTVPAGERSCVKIRTNLSWGGDMEWFDYVDPQGLVKRTLQFDVIITTQESPETGEAAVVFEQAELLWAGFTP